MTRTFAVVAIAASLASPAFAADMPVKAPVAPAAVAYGWTGCYVGGNAGWLRSDARIKTAPTGPAFLGAPVALNSHSYDLDDSSLTGGAQASCNWQRANWVYGFEADVNWTGASRTTAVTYPQIGPFLAHTETLTHRLSWFATVRGRLGVALMDRTLAYATGGLAIGRVKSSFTYFVPQFNFTFFGEDAPTRLGWTVGGGLEHAFGNNWSVKAEYLYLDFGSFNYDSTIAIAPGENYTAYVRSRAHVARVGLNYKFGAGPAVARY